MAIAAALHPRVTPFNGVNNDYSHSSEDDDDVRDSSSSIDLLPLERAVSEDARSQDSHGFTGLLRTNVRDGVQQALRPFLSGNDRGGPWAPIPQNDSGYAYESGIGLDLGRPAMSSVSSLREMILASWLNSLLVFVPVGLVSYLSGMSPILTFVTNVIAIVPLSALLTDATERIANDAGDTVGALLNISLGNLVELIIFAASHWSTITSGSCKPPSLAPSSSTCS
ncbi:Vacuolar calcium ion transporter like protein [Verticillium longisporum]|nr:Vacuolar calcium ion transporter like protein [Verticillium longisporum]